MAGFNQNTNQPGNNGGGWNSDFSGQLNNILAPYQQMSQQFQSPYATMKANSWLAQNHPQVAGVLDNAFLTMGMTPQPQGPEGVGGGLTRAMQGLIGGQQFNRQRMMQQAMMPYQMMAPALQSMDTLSQMNERNAMVPFRMAQEKRMDAQSSLYYDRIAQGDRSKALAGPDIIDDKGGSWSRVFDPIAEKTRLFNPVLQKHADELPSDQQPAFTNEAKGNRRAQAGGLLGEIMDQQDSPDPAIAAQGHRRYTEYIQAQGAIQGARTGASNAVTEPAKDLKTFVGNERSAAYAQLPKVMSAQDWMKANMGDTNTYKPGAYDKYVKGVQDKRQVMDQDLAKYEKSSAPRMGVSFQEYMKPENRPKYDGSAPNPTPASTHSGPNWSRDRK